jgi:hypothetical protein
VDLQSVLTVASVIIALASLLVSLRTGQRSAALASEQEQVRRLVRNDAIYGLVAVYELMGDLSTYVWMAAEDGRVDSQYVTTFLEDRVADLNRIHGSAAYFYWKHSVSTFQLERTLREEPLDQIIGADLLGSDLGQRLATTGDHGIGTDLVALELNAWIATVDALHRLRTPREEVLLSEGEEARNAAVETYGIEGAFVLKILHRYFNRCEILARLLRYYAPRISLDLNRALDTLDRGVESMSAARSYPAPR